MNLIFFSWEPWDETMRKRSVAFTLALMQEMGLRRALYVNPPLRIPLLFRRRKPAFYHLQIRCLWPRTFGNVMVITPICPLPFQFARFNAFFARLELKLLKRACRLHPFIYVNNNPQAAEIRPAFSDAVFTALDMSDDFEQLASDDDVGSGQPIPIRKAIAAAVQDADIVLAVNGKLATRFSQAGKFTIVLRNAVALEFFDQARLQQQPMPAAFQPLSRPIIGMLGGIDPRTDYALLLHLSEARPDWTYVFLGTTPDNTYVPQELQCKANCHFLPPVDYAQLPCYLAQFNVGFMPYRQNALTQMIDPRRAYDYLAAGLPVVSTPVGGLEEFGDLVRIASTPPEFLAAIEEALGDNSPARTQKRIRYAAENSWQARARQFATLQVVRSLREPRPPTRGLRLKARAKRLLSLATPVGRLSFKLSRHLERGGLPDCGVPEPAGRFLFSIAETTPGNGEIVEIGSCFGRSTIYLAKGAYRSDCGTVWAVDPHTGDIAWHLGRVSTYEVFLQNIRKFGVESRVKPLKMTSQEAARSWNGAPIRILFIDGWHSYEAVTEDILLWFPHVVPGGLIVFDDYSNPEFPGVRQAVDDQMQKLPVEKPLRMAATLAWTRKL